ncbi:MAG TPA: hypothetical protein VGX25_23250 [Actinophytocola sp.]|uniref:hypothetical protein n=1 Tax=Actinophytocola sp. TaxID=1872138 RepID=UPI002DDDB832|nr:hypothetical protein [Actinophytocola sp.]HEV2782319.1 hypothetical protein [Actinophytocola sp.]
MSTPPLQVEAYRLLREDLYKHLEEAEYLATKYEPWSPEDGESARLVIADLVTVIRAMIAMHDSPDRVEPCGCQTCGTTWPCLALRTIHRLIKDPDGEFVKLVRRREP